MNAAEMKWRQVGSSGQRQSCGTLGSTEQHALKGHTQPLPVPDSAPKFPDWPTVAHTGCLQEVATLTPMGGWRRKSCHSV